MKRIVIKMILWSQMEDTRLFNTEDNVDSKMILSMILCINDALKFFKNFEGDVFQLYRCRFSRDASHETSFDQNWKQGSAVTE